MVWYLTWIWVTLETIYKVLENILEVGHIYTFGDISRWRAGSAAADDEESQRRARRVP